MLEIVDVCMEQPLIWVCCWCVCIGTCRTKKAVTLKDVGVETPGIERSREGALDKIFKKNHA